MNAKCHCGKQATLRDRATGSLFCRMHKPDGSVCERIRKAKKEQVVIKTAFRPGKQQEFGWLPPDWKCEPVGIGFGAFLGTGRTEQEAIDDFVWKIKSQTGVEIETVHAAYEEGREAKKQGIQPTANPYESLSMGWTMWNRGWADANG